MSQTLQLQNFIFVVVSLKCVWVQNVLTGVKNGHLVVGDLFSSKHFHGRWMLKMFLCNMQNMLKQLMAALGLNFVVWEWGKVIKTFLERAI